MILFDKVNFSYGDRYILKDFTFSIRADERVAILGKSGGGKTTILRLIMGLIKPDAGRIIIDGDDITDKTEQALRDARMKFSIVFQEGALFDSLTVKENVAFCLREYGSMSEEEIGRTVTSLLRRVGVGHAEELMPEELSGGMHRRVAIARSLAAFEPKMFLYDEPTSGLDPVNADTICRLIADLSRDGRGLVIVTHKVSDAMKVADRFVFLKDGEVHFDGDKETFIHAPDEEIQAFITELQYGENRTGHPDAQRS
jgi:phospholipid/cholesterol/gamma-HCH transport system ATP-binding protein